MPRPAQPGSRPGEIPTISRCFPCALLAVLLGVPETATAAPPAPALDEQTAVERALANPAVDDWRAGKLASARASSGAAARWSNPNVNYTREQLLGSAPVGEDYITVSQTFDVSGRKSLARKAARHRVRGAERRADAWERDLRAEARLRFYALLAAEARHDTIEAWRDHVARQTKAASLRQQAGDAPTYDRLRLERELAGVETSLAGAEADRARAWSRLRALIDPGREQSAEIPTLRGELLPPPVKRDKVAVTNAARSSPSLEALDADRSAAQLDRRAGRRWWIANPTVGGGYKGVDIPGGARGHGFVFSLGVALPILDRKQTARASAEGEVRTAAAESALATSEVLAEAEALWDELSVISSRARKLRADAEHSDIALLRAAESGYRGGEIGVMELVDAYRTVAEAKLEWLDLADQARRARIELDRLAGGPS